MLRAGEFEPQSQRVRRQLDSERKNHLLLFVSSIYSCMYFQFFTNHETSSSLKIAVWGTPSSLITPRYIPGQFKGMDAFEMQFHQL